MLTDKLPHGWQVLATLLAVASVFTLCWYLSQMGLLDLAATGVSYFALHFMRQVAPSIAKRSPHEFQRTAGLLDQAREDFAQWVANRRALSLAILSFVFTVIFLVVRYLASIIMAAIASPWLALAVGLALSACVASPVLVREIVQGLKKKVG